MFVVAGGSHPTHAYWLQGTGPHVHGKPIRVPETFEALLAEADRDLGCGSEECRSSGRSEIRGLAEGRAEERLCPERERPRVYPRDGSLMAPQGERLGENLVYDRANPRSD